MKVWVQLGIVQKCARCPLLITTTLLYLTEQSFFGSSLKLYSNLLFKGNKTMFFPSFYRETVLHWKNHLVIMTEIVFLYLSQYQVYHEKVRGDNISIKFSLFFKKNMHYCRFSYAGTWELVNLFVLSGQKKLASQLPYLV